MAFADALRGYAYPMRLRDGFKCVYSGCDTGVPVSGRRLDRRPDSLPGDDQVGAEVAAVRGYLAGYLPRMIDHRPGDSTRPRPRLQASAASLTCSVRA